MESQNSAEFIIEQTLLIPELWTLSILCIIGTFKRTFCRTLGI